MELSHLENVGSLFKKYFPNSEALISNKAQATLGFDTALSMVGI